MQEISDAQIVISEESVGRVYFNIQDTVHEFLGKPLISQSKQPSHLTFLTGAGCCLQWLQSLTPRWLDGSLVREWEMSS